MNALSANPDSPSAYATTLCFWCGKPATPPHFILNGVHVRRCCGACAKVRTSGDPGNPPKEPSVNPLFCCYCEQTVPDGEMGLGKMCHVCIQKRQADGKPTWQDDMRPSVIERGLSALLSVFKG